MAAEKSEKKTSWFLGEANSGWEPNQNGAQMSHMNMRGKRLREHTTEECLHLHSADSASSAVAEDEATDIDNALSIDEKLDLSIGLADVVEPNALADGGPCARGEAETATSNRGTVGGIAVGCRSDIANLAISSEARLGVGWKIGIELSLSTSAPHKAR